MSRPDENTKTFRQQCNEIWSQLPIKGNVWVSIGADLPGSCPTEAFYILRPKNELHILAMETLRLEKYPSGNFGHKYGWEHTPFTQIQEAGIRAEMERFIATYDNFA